VICSYQFARSKESYVRQTAWDLVVVDEAHRLRNVYKPGNKISQAIKQAIFPDGARGIQFAGTVGLRRSAGFLVARPHADHIGLDQRGGVTLRTSRAENAPDPCALFSETPQSQRSRHGSAWHFHFIFL
jgi:hypothetical protein